MKGREFNAEKAVLNLKVGFGQGSLIFCGCLEWKLQAYTGVSGLDSSVCV